MKWEISTGVWLFLWTLTNIGVTLLNKAAFATVSFNYPYFLSAIHMICNTAGAECIFWWLRRCQQQKQKHQQKQHAVHQRKDSISVKVDTEKEGIEAGKQMFTIQDSSSPLSQFLQSSPSSTTTKATTSSTEKSLIVLLLGDVQRKQLDVSGQRIILAFSVIFSMNIAIGNVSLQYVSVNFNQVMRSLMPAMTIAMELCLGHFISLQRLQATVPVVVGVAMTCFGDMSYTALGFLYTFLCVALAALKVVVSGEILTGPLKLHPVDLLGHMAPLAFVQCLALAFINGEINSIVSRWNTDLSPKVTILPMFVVWLSGFFAFFLNICSLQVNKLTSPLTMCLVAIVKQVLMIVTGTIIFGSEISTLNGLGILVVLIGSSWYSYICVVEATTVTKEAVERRHNETVLSLSEDETEIATISSGCTTSRDDEEMGLV